MTRRPSVYAGSGGFREHLDLGQAATVSVNFDGTNVRFTFGIPRAADGVTGPQGEQGPTGEVTNATLANAAAPTTTPME